MINSVVQCSSAAWQRVPTVHRHLSLGRGLKVRPHRYACTYPAPTGEMQGANRIAWRNALSRQTGIVRVSGESDGGRLGNRQLVQGLRVGSGPTAP